MAIKTISSLNIFDGENSFEEKGTFGAYQRYVSPTRNSSLNNFEEEFLLGTDTISEEIKITAATDKKVTYKTMIFHKNTGGKSSLKNYYKVISKDYTKKAPSAAVDGYKIVNIDDLYFVNEEGEDIHIATKVKKITTNKTPALERVSIYNYLNNDKLKEIAKLREEEESKLEELRNSSEYKFAPTSIKLTMEQELDSYYNGGNGVITALELSNLSWSEPTLAEWAAATPDKLGDYINSLPNFLNKEDLIKMYNGLLFTPDKTYNKVKIRKEKGNTVTPFSIVYKKLVLNTGTYRYSDINVNDTTTQYLGLSFDIEDAEGNSLLYDIEEEEENVKVNKYINILRDNTLVYFKINFNKTFENVDSIDKTAILPSLFLEED